jgi:hypothetical protein
MLACLLNEGIYAWRAATAKGTKDEMLKIKQSVSMDLKKTISKLIIVAIQRIN